MKTPHNYLNHVSWLEPGNQPKKFWSYVRQRHTESSGIPTLRDATSMYINTKVLINISRALSPRIMTPYLILAPCSTCTSNIEDRTFSVSGVKKQLEKLNASKAAGPDGSPARILHDLSAEIAKMIAFICQQSFEPAHCPQTGRLPWLPLFLRKTKELRTYYLQMFSVPKICMISANRPPCLL